MTASFAVDAAGVRRWTCDGCGAVGPWSDSHQWYGSWRDLEDGKLIVITCSQACREHLGDEPLEAVQSGLPQRTRSRPGRPVVLPEPPREPIVDVPVHRRPSPTGGQAA